jgi:hypothetical protein
VYLFTSVANGSTTGGLATLSVSHEDKLCHHPTPDNCMAGCGLTGVAGISRLRYHGTRQALVTALIIVVENPLYGEEPYDLPPLSRDLSLSSYTMRGKRLHARKIKISGLSLF